MPNDFSSPPSGSMPSAPSPAPSRHESRWPFLLETLLVVLALAGLAAYMLTPRLKLYRQYAGRKTMVAMWALIAERPIAEDILKQGTSMGVAGKGFQTVRIDSAALFKVLHDPSAGHRIHFCVCDMGWLQESSKHFPSNYSPLSGGSYPQPDFGLYQDVQISVHTEYQFKQGLPEARLNFHADCVAALSQRDRKSFHTTDEYKLNGSFELNGVLKPGESVAGLAPILPSGSTRGEKSNDPEVAREPHLIVVLQAINVDLALGRRLANFSDARRWLAGGEDGVIELLDLVQAWEARAVSAGAKGGVITTAAGSLRIMAIGQPRRWPGCWWDADGNPVPGRPDWSRQYRDDVLAVLVEMPRGQEGMTDMDLSLDLGNGRKARCNYISKSSDFGGIVQIFLFSDADTRIAKELPPALERGAPLTLAVAQAAGPWEELGRIREGETKEYAGGRFTIKKVKPRRVSPPDVSDRVLVEGDYTFDPAFEIALLGVARDGRRSKFSDRRNEKWSPYVSVGMAQGEIENFAILRRPLTRATLGAIPSRPRILPDTLLPPRRAEATTMTLTQETQTSATVPGRSGP